MRRQILFACGVPAALLIGAGLVVLLINRAIDSRSGPVHRFQTSAGETFLSEERALVVAREVMNRDGLSQSAWKLTPDARSKAPDGRPDEFLVRNTENSNRGLVHFWNHNSRTPQRIVAIEWREGEITAQGTYGK